MKKAYIFPGQGAQYPGMGRELYENSGYARDLFERANEILGFKITDIMFEGSAEALKATKVTQPAIFLHSTILAMCYKHMPASSLKEKNLPEYGPDMVAGHSLGEFSALTVSGALDFEDALKLVALRAQEMQKCCEQIPGTMAAIIGLETGLIEQICLGCDGMVVPANYNFEGQIVISGEEPSVQQACRLATNAGAKRAILLPVSGAFHSPLMKPASLELRKGIEKTPFYIPNIPIYQNVSTKPETDPKIIKKNLLSQLTYPVKWTQSVSNMIKDGADYFIEMGPGNVLQGLVKRISEDKVKVESISCIF